MAKSRASLDASSFRISRIVFLRALAAIFAIAFLSLWVQVDGLFGSEGILPAAEFLKALPSGAIRYWYVPSLFWLWPSNAMLHLLCGFGLVVSLVALAGYFQASALALAWLLYLSLVAIGQDFMSFQWDVLLLEAGALGALWATGPWDGFLWLVRWLLFRLMFESGCVKLLSGDPHWRDLSALRYHFETQPLPTWIGWYAHQLPDGLLKLSTFFMFVIELAASWFIFAPRPGRLIGAALLILLQLLIAATGNYCFFNCLTIALCLPLIDDAVWRRWIPRLRPSEPVAPESRGHLGKHWRVGVLCLVGACTSAELFGVFGISLGPLTVLSRIVGPLRSTNSYGLFAVMTTERDEIVLEGSRDGKEWEPYEFKWKPGDMQRRPRFVAPHQPRLDWQMWFAALGDYRQNPWLLNLMARLLEGSRPVIRLLARDPFPDAPPRQIRAVVYQYHFTDLKERLATGAWWKREYKGLYAPVLRVK